MHWYPPRPMNPVERHVFGGRAITERLGRRGLPDAASVIAGCASQWLGRDQIQGQVDVLIGYLLDLECDVRETLVAAGYAPEVKVALGEDLTAFESLTTCTGTVRRSSPHMSYGVGHQSECWCPRCDET